MSENKFMPFGRPLNLDLWVEPIVKKENAILPKDYYIDQNVTSIRWKDGTRTVVKRLPEDQFNPRLGFLTAFFQKYSGLSKNKANKYLADLEVRILEDKEEVNKKGK